MLLKDEIGDFFSYDKYEDADVVGIEIELEAEDEFPPPARTRHHWRHLGDGSLRGNYNAEYVLRDAMTLPRAFKALDNLTGKLREYGTRILDSVRAGTHVHINVGDLTFREMWVMVTCWYVLEELLTDTMCGEGRSGNHFCLRAKDADMVLARVGNAVTKGNLNGLGNDDVRYSALNFVSLFKYGSLEFRAMRSPKDFTLIKEWVGVLMNLKNNSKKYRNPRHVIENFSLGGEENFLKGIVGNAQACTIMLRDPEWEHKLQGGVRIAQEIGYAVDDWDKENEIKAERVFIAAGGLRPHQGEWRDIVEMAAEKGVIINV